MDRVTYIMKKRLQEFNGVIYLNHQRSIKMNKLLIIFICLTSILLVGCKNTVNQLNKLQREPAYTDTLTMFIDKNERVISVSLSSSARSIERGFLVTLFNNEYYYTKYISTWDLPMTMNGNQLLIKYKSNIK